MNYEPDGKTISLTYDLFFSPFFYVFFVILYSNKKWAAWSSTLQMIKCVKCDVNCWEMKNKKSAHTSFSSNWLRNRKTEHEFGNELLDVMYYKDTSAFGERKWLLCVLLLDWLKNLRNIINEKRVSKRTKKKFAIEPVRNKQSNYETRSGLGIFELSQQWKPFISNMVIWINKT